MRFGNNELKTVLLLGAGATRGAVPRVVVNRKRIKPPLNGDFFKVAETFARAMGVGSIEAKRLARLRRVFRDELPAGRFPTMETAFNLLYIAKDFPEIYKAGPGPRPEPGERRELQDFLKTLFGILVCVDQKAGPDTGYDRLVDRLGPEDTVITLNYDTLLDAALVRRGWDPKKGYAIPGDAKKIGSSGNGVGNFIGLS